MVVARCRLLRVAAIGYTMATAKPNQKISLDKLEATLGKLEQLEEKQPEELTLRESIHFLRDKLLKALKKGYSYQDLSEILEQQGILVSAATLKQYLTESSKEAAKGKRASKSGQAGQTRQKATKAIDREVSEANIASEQKVLADLSKPHAEESQETRPEDKTKRFEESEVKLSKESEQVESGDNQESQKKPVRSKQKKLSSSSTDLSSEFNQY